MNFFTKSAPATPAAEKKKTAKSSGYTSFGSFGLTEPASPLPKKENKVAAPKPAAKPVAKLAAKPAAKPAAKKVEPKPAKVEEKIVYGDGHNNKGDKKISATNASALGRNPENGGVNLNEPWVMGDRDWKKVMKESCDECPFGHCKPGCPGRPNGRNPKC